MTNDRAPGPPLPAAGPSTTPAGEGVPAAIPGGRATQFPWTRRELWLATALPGAILVAFTVFILTAEELLNWSEAERSAVSILFGPSLVLLAWVLLVRGKGIRRGDLGLRAFRPGGSLLVPMLLAVDFIFVLVYTGFLDMYGLLPAVKATQTLPLAVVNSVIVAPVCEELFHRGLLFTGFRHHYGARKAAALSAAVFAVYHLDPLFFVHYFISGITLAALLDATGSIWPAIALHAVWNTWIVMGEAGFWIVALIAFLTIAVVSISPLWFALHRFWQRASGPPPP
jgi:membrane protease YdiL (CAAX protease family)